MDLLIELILDLLIDGGMEVVSLGNVSKKIRIPIFIFIILLYLVIIIGIILLGFMLYNESKLGSLFMIILGIVLLVLFSLKFTKIYHEKFKKKRKERGIL